MKYLAAIFTAVFVVLAIVNFDRVDPLAWVGIYGYGAVVSIMVMGGRYPIFPIIVGTVLYLFLTVYHFYAISQRLQPFSEGLWRGLSLLVGFIAMATYLVAAFQRRNQPKHDEQKND